MFRKSLTIITILIVTQLGCSKDLPPSKKIFEMSNVEIDQLLTATARKNMTITERINYFSEMFLDMPYDLTCTGDGPYALYETRPLVNFDETNCMVFCEHVLALSISDSWDNFFNNLQRIRYQNGIIGMRTRNHYTMADWLPENRWLLDDVSRKVGGQYTKTTTRTISHKTFFQKKGITDLRYVRPDRVITIDYIPKENLLNVKKNVKPGDILALIFANKTDIFSAHMLMVTEKNGKLYIRESSNSKMSTFDTPYDEWVNSKLDMDKYAGLCFMRIREDFNQAGKIILPWEISTLKEK